MLSMIRIIDTRSAMLPDDVFRHRLEQTLLEIEATAARLRDCAAVSVTAKPKYWRAIIMPNLPAACPLDLMICADQTFNLKLANEAHTGLPVERFEFFPDLFRAIEAGHVEKISKYCAMTDALVAVAMHVALAPGRDWIRERRLSPTSAAEAWRTHRYLPYRRSPENTRVSAANNLADA
jgi:hypothetical protein